MKKRIIKKHFHKIAKKSIKENKSASQTAWEKACGQYGRVDDAVKLIDPRTDEEVK